MQHDYVSDVTLNTQEWSMVLPRIIQIEVTTACQLRCLFCPHTALGDNWIKTHMSWETFSCLLPFVRHTRLVHLQGWGEPLLNPRLWDMAAAIRERRGRVSLTTNAMLLDDDAAQEILRIGFDLVAVSVAGAQGEKNDSLRIGSDFERICANIDHLCSLKRHPKVHLVMQMMKVNMEELPELVRLAARLGVDEVIAPNLDYSPAHEVDDLRAFDRSPDSHYMELTNEAVREGKELGVKVHIAPLSPRDDVLMCDADPPYNVWISASGEVTSCPYLAMSLRGKTPRVFWKEIEELPRFSYGNVRSGLDSVLNGQVARAFREAYTRRLLADRVDAVTEANVASMPRVSSSSVHFFESLARMTSKDRRSEIPPPPDICRKCYKLYGL